MSLGRLVQSSGWPVAFGLLLALLALLVFPDLRPGNSRAVPPGSAADGRGPAAASYAEAVNRAAPAVVNIYARRASPHRRPGEPQLRHPLDPPRLDPNQPSLGSGVIVSTAGYLLTNYHVVNGTEEILVVLNDGRNSRAELVGTDPESDLAVLRIPLSGLTAIELGDPTLAQVGDVVLAIGNPFGVGQSVTQGILSATGRHGLGVNIYENFLQTDAAIHPGNSGGALVDTRGRLLGINTAILDHTGISFAIPADAAMKSLGDIIEHGSVIRGWLGVTARPLTPDEAQGRGVRMASGMLVEEVIPQSPAHRAGLRERDVITHIDGQPVWDRHQSLTRVAEARPGSELSIRVVRGGEIMEFSATVGVRPDPRRTRT